MIFEKLFSGHYTQGDRYIQGRYIQAWLYVQINHSIYVLLTKTSNSNVINMIKMAHKMSVIYFVFHVLFIMLYNEVWTFTSVNETQVCDHSNESYMY